MEEATLVDFNKRRDGATEARRRSTRARARSSPTTRSSCSTRRGSRPPQRDGARGVRRLPARADHAARSPRAAGFRPGDPTAKPRCADRRRPRRRPDAAGPCSALPEPRVLARIKARWRAGPQAGQRDAGRRHVRLDGRGGQDRPGQARPAGLLARALAARPRRADRRSTPGLTAPSPIAPVRRQPAAAHAGASTDLIPDGETAVYDATAAAQDRRRACTTTPHQRGCRAHRRPGQLQLADPRGADLDARRRRRAARAAACACSRSPTGGRADRGVLAQDRAASGGKEFSGDPNDIEAVYRTISSFF